MSIGRPAAAAARRHPSCTALPTSMRWSGTPAVAVLPDRRERRDRSDPLGPERAADEGGLRRCHDRRDADDRRHRIPVGHPLREHGDVGNHAEGQVHAAGDHAPSGGDLVEDEHRAASASRARARVRGTPAPDPCCARGSRTIAASSPPCAAAIASSSSSRVVVKRQHRARSGRAARRPARAPASRCPSSACSSAEVRREIPVVPAVIPAERDRVAARGGAGEADRDRHRFPAAPAVAHHPAHG